MSRIVIVDIDGTIADGTHRLHLLPAEEDRGDCEKWAEFNKACIGDKPILSTIRIVRSLIKDYHIVLLTGRGAQAQLETELWLKQHKVPHHELIMRAVDDHRPDYEYKHDAITKLCQGNYGEIECAFDDLEHVVKHFRSLGITAYLVTHYDTPRPDSKLPPEEKQDATTTSSNS